MNPNLPEKTEAEVTKMRLAQILKALKEHPLATELADCIVDLKMRVASLEGELDEARSIAQHLLDCARGNDVVQQDLPDWLEDEDEDEREEEEEEV